MAQLSESNGLYDEIFTNSPPLKDFNNLSNGVFTDAANAGLEINTQNRIINIFFID